MPPAYSSVRDDIMAPQHWAQSERHMNAGVTPYGLPELRVLMSGAYIVCGVKIDEITAGSHLLGAT